MNKTRTYVFSFLLAALMVTACTLEGGIETVLGKAGIEKGNPNAPSGVTARALSSSSIWIIWNSVSGVEGYLVFRSYSAYGEYVYIGITYSTEFTDTGLSADTTYYYKVSAYIPDVADLPLSSYVSATTESSSGSGIPDAPSGVTAQALSSSSITISWNPVSGALGYNVYRSSSAFGSYDYIGMVYTIAYTDTELSANTTYYYKVAAFNGSYVESSQSSYASATTESSSIDINRWWGSYLSAGEIHTYRFYANSGNYFIKWEDADIEPSYADIKVGLKREGASSYIVDVTDVSVDSRDVNTINFSVSISGYYIMEVHGYGSSSSGSYNFGVFDGWWSPWRRGVSVTFNNEEWVN